MTDLQETYLERVRRDRQQRRELLGFWVDDPECRELRAEGWSVADVEAFARSELAGQGWDPRGGEDDDSLLERAMAHRTDPYMRAQRIAYHERGAVRERAVEAWRRAVPSILAGKVPPDYGQDWPEISR
jgi:hypothetical protein